MIYWPRMKAVILLCGIGLCQCVAATAETNPACTTLSLAAPTLQLRSLSLGTHESARVPIPSPNGKSLLPAPELLSETDVVLLSVPQSTGPLAAQADFSYHASDLEMQVYRRLDAGGYLTRPEAETPISHFVDRTFSPELFHIGNVTGACTVYTAIKRKNPLCLLNPLFLFLSW